MSWCDGWSRTPRSIAELDRAGCAPGRRRRARRVRVRMRARRSGRADWLDRWLVAAALRSASAARRRHRRRSSFMLGERSATAWSRASTCRRSSTRSRTRATRLANAAGFRIMSIALVGPAAAHAARRSSPPPASPARPRCCSSTSSDARERLKTNPWIADATVLKLYPGRAADRHQGARGLRALAEGRPGVGHRRRRHRARALRRAAA